MTSIPKIESSPSFQKSYIVPSLALLCIESIMRNNAIHKVDRVTKMDSLTTRLVALYKKKQVMVGNIFEILRKFPNAFAYGGYYRDEMAMTKFHDIDLSLGTETSAIEFIKKLSRNYHILVVQRSYAGCFSLCVQDMIDHEIVIRMDVTYTTPLTNSYHDLDVNMLKSTYPAKDKVPVGQRSLPLHASF